MTRIDLDGTPRAKTTMDISVLSRLGASARAAVRPCRRRPATELLVVDAGDLRAWWFFAEDKDVAYPAAEYDAAVASVPGGYG